MPAGVFGIPHPVPASDPWPPLYDHAFHRSLTVVTGMSVALSAGWGGEATDGDSNTSYGANTGTMPQQYVYDFGTAPPPSIGSARLRFADSGHTSYTGSLDASADGVAWVSVASWANDATQDKWLVFRPIARRWWRVRSTANVSGGNGLNVSRFCLFSCGRNVALGKTVTGYNVGAPTFASATDGSEGSRASATSGGVYPNGYTVDLGAPYVIIGGRVMFGDISHSALSGSLQYSNDDVTFTDALVWRERQAEHFADFRAHPISARYWRVNCTQVISNNGLDLTEIELATAT